MDSAEIKWKLCIICQSDTQESLHCSAVSKRSDLPAGHGYSTFLENVRMFKEMGIMLKTLNLDKFDKGCGVLSSLLSHKAKWHKSCRETFSNTRLARAQNSQKRKQEQKPDEQVLLVQFKHCLTYAFFVTKFLIVQTCILHQL